MAHGHRNGPSGAGAAGEAFAAFWMVLDNFGNMVHNVEKEGLYLMGLRQDFMERRKKGCG